MDKYSDYIAQEVNRRKLKIQSVADKAGMTYMQLYNSLFNKDRNRPLRANEYIALCEVLDLDVYGASNKQ